MPTKKQEPVKRHVTPIPTDLKRLIHQFFTDSKEEVYCLHFGVGGEIIMPYPFWIHPNWHTLIVTQHIERIDILAEYAIHLEYMYGEFLKPSASDLQFYCEKLEWPYSKCNMVVFDLTSKEVYRPLFGKNHLLPDLIIVQYGNEPFPEQIDFSDYLFEAQKGLYTAYTEFQGFSYFVLNSYIPGKPSKLRQP